VFEVAMWVKSTHLIKLCLKIRKIGENVEIKNYVYLNLKDCLGIEFTAAKAR